MIRLKATCLISACFVLLLSGAVYCKSLSCEECRQLDRERSRVQLELTKKEREMERAFKKKEFRKVTDLRNAIVELRRKHLTLKSKQPECKIACRPDVVKQAECEKIVAELAEKDSEDLSSATEREEIDERYKDLVTCNRELKRLKQLHR